MTAMTLDEAIAEVKRYAASNYSLVLCVDGKSVETLLQAVASGDLIPASDARLAVALAYQKAGGAIQSHSDTARKKLSETYDSGDAEANGQWSCIVAHLDIAHDAILALADQGLGLKGKNLHGESSNTIRKR